MNKKIIVPLIVIGLLASVMTVDAGNIGIAITNTVTTIREAVISLATVVINLPPNDNFRSGQTTILVNYTTTNVSGAATKTYSLNGAANVTLPDGQFNIDGVDNGLVDNGTLNNITLYIDDPSNGTAQATRFFKVDITAPRQITDIANKTGTNWINWTWVNPTNTDFNNTIVNVTKGTTVVVPDTKLPKDINYYNVTGLDPDTPYTISVKTEDNAPGVF